MKQQQQQKINGAYRTVFSSDTAQHTLVLTGAMEEMPPRERKAVASLFPLVRCTVMRTVTEKAEEDGQRRNEEKHRECVCV